MNKILNKILIIILLECFILLSSCSNEMYIYYSNYENYVEVTGKISYLNYNDDNDELYIAFDDLSGSFSDNCFKISGKNFAIIKNNNIENAIECGKIVEFVSAPKYYGDGYVMPIVSITIDDVCFLDIDEGIYNLLQSIWR